jgi:hypothetical protein
LAPGPKAAASGMGSFEMRELINWVSNFVLRRIWLMSGQRQKLGEITIARFRDDILFTGYRGD